MNEPVTQAMLEAYVTGELESGAAARVEEHLRSSPADAAVVRRLQTIIRTMRTDADGPSSETVESAIRLSRPPTSILEKLIAGIHTTIAALVHDSRATPALAGFRSVQEAVELAYAAESIEIEMRCEPIVEAGFEKWSVVGQVSRTDGTGNQLALHFVPVVEDEVIAEVSVCSAGMFSTKINGGNYDVILRSGENVIVMTDLEL